MALSAYSSSRGGPPWVTHFPRTNRSEQLEYVVQQLRRLMKFPRRGGILLHPTSLPGSTGIGDFGTEAYRFIDFLEQSGNKLWQVLPLNPVRSRARPTTTCWRDE